MSFDRKLRALDASDVAAIGALSEADPARSLIANILQVAPVSHWSFARFKSDGNANELLRSRDSTEDQEGEFRRVRAEFVLQRQVAARGPRMAATIAPLIPPFTTGLVMLFAHRGHELGILTLLRADALGRFTLIETRVLALALDASADMLTPLPFAEMDARRLAREALMRSRSATGEADGNAQAPPEMLVLDTDFNIVFSWSDAEKRRASVRSRAAMKNRLPRILEETVHRLTSTWTSAPGTQHRDIAVPLPFLIVRTQPLHGSEGVFIGVLLDRVPRTRPVLRAADHFVLSPREIQTLALLLDGATLDDICERMHITSSTVQDNIKSLISKTGSRNRSEMLAKILDWPGAQVDL